MAANIGRDVVGARSINAWLLAANDAVASFCRAATSIETEECTRRTTVAASFGGGGGGRTAIAIVCRLFRHFIHSFIHIRLLKTEMTERICTSNRNTRRI